MKRTGRPVLRPRFEASRAPHHLADCAVQELLRRCTLAQPSNTSFSLPIACPPVLAIMICEQVEDHISLLPLRGPRPHYAISRTSTAPSPSRRTLNGSAVVAIGVGRRGACSDLPRPPTPPLGIVVLERPTRELISQRVEMLADVYPDGSTSASSINISANSESQLTGFGLHPPYVEIVTCSEVR